MKSGDINPAPLSAVTSKPQLVLVTGVIHDGHWLGYQSLNILWIADDLEDEARKLWPDARFSVPVGRSLVSSPETKSVGGETEITGI